MSGEGQPRGPYFRQGLIDRSEATLEAEAVIYDAVGFEHRRALSIGHLGFAAAARGQTERALALLDEAVEMAEAAATSEQLLALS